MPTIIFDYTLIIIQMITNSNFYQTLLGIGPKKAITLIREHKNIETILTKIDTTKYPPPEDWPYKEARRLVHSSVFRY